MLPLWSGETAAESAGFRGSKRNNARPPLSPVPASQAPPGLKLQPKAFGRDRLFLDVDHPEDIEKAEAFLKEINER